MNGLKDFKDIKFLVTGDFNFGFLRSWASDRISDFVVDTNYGSENDARIDVKKRQAMSLFDMTDTWKLRQKEFLKE